MALILELKKRSQAERMAICETLLGSIWEEMLAGDVDKSILQTAIFCQSDLDCIVWRLNRKGKCPYTDKYCEDWNCVKCDVNQDEIQFLQELQKELDEEGDNNGRKRIDQDVLSEPRPHHRVREEGGLPPAGTGEAEDADV